MSRPNTAHWDTALHVLRYLKTSPSLRLFFAANYDLSIRGYSDADWGACLDTRRSLTGYCIFLGSSLIS